MTTSNADIMEIDGAKLKRMKMLHVHFLLFDVRPKEAYEAGHIQGALNVPATEFLNRLPQMVPQKDTPMVVYDEEGRGTADLILAAERSGYTNLVNLEGGYQGARHLFG